MVYTAGIMKVHGRMSDKGTNMCWLAPFCSSWVMNSSRHKDNPADEQHVSLSPEMLSRTHD